MSILVFGTHLNSTETMASYSASSSLSGYSEAEAMDLSRRKKTWRSGGFWEITASNNVLIFRETVGVDLTATVAVADYATDTSFLAAIKTALEATGASTYTVSRDATTNAIKILSNGAGGGGVFQLRNADALSTLAPVIGFSTAGHLTGALTYTADLQKIHTSEWLLWDLGFAANPTGVMLTSDRIAGLKFSDTAVVKIQGNATNNWNAPSVDITIPLSDFTMSYIDTDGFGSYRWWRLYIQDAGNAFGYVEIGAVMLGIHTTITRGAPVFPLTATSEERSLVDISSGGQSITGKKPATQTFVLNWRGLDIASKENLDIVFDYYGKHSAFFVAMDQTGAFSSSAADWCKLVKFSGNVDPVLVSPGNWSLDWPLREEL